MIARPKFHDNVNFLFRNIAVIYVVAKYLGLSEAELVKFAFQKQIIYKFIYRRMAWIVIHSKIHLKHSVCNIVFQFM